MESEEAYEVYLEGMAALEQGAAGEALDRFYRSNEIAPHFKTHLRIAGLLRSQGDTEGASRHVAQAYELNPRNDQAAVEYARLLVERERLDDARHVLEEALQRNGDYGPARQLLDELSLGR